MPTQNQSELLKITDYTLPAEYFSERIYEIAIWQNLLAPDSKPDIASDPTLARILDNYGIFSEGNSSATRRWQGLIEFQSLCERYGRPWQEALRQLDALFQNSGITPGNPEDIEIALLAIK